MYEVLHVGDARGGALSGTCSCPGDAPGLRAPQARRRRRLLPPPGVTGPPVPTRRGFRPAFAGFRRPRARWSCVPPRRPSPWPAAGGLRPPVPPAWATKKRTGHDKERFAMLACPRAMMSALHRAADGPGRRAMRTGELRPGRRTGQAHRRETKPRGRPAGTRVIRPVGCILFVNQVKSHTKKTNKTSPSRPPGRYNIYGMQYNDSRLLPTVILCVLLGLIAFIARDCCTPTRATTAARTCRLCCAPGPEVPLTFSHLPPTNTPRGRRAQYLQAMTRPHILRGASWHS